MAYTQHGVGAFISLTLDYPESFPAREFVVAVGADQNVDGFADFRVHDGNVAFLSYICVRAESRGHGLATRLIRGFLEGRPEIGELRLEVFRDNIPAKRLYERLGFDSVGSSVWLTRELPKAEGSKLQVNSLETSVASHREYGFCELDVLFEGQKVKLGLLGSSVVRCFTVDDFANDDLLAAARQTFENTDLAFLVVDAAAMSGISGGYEVINTSDQMVYSAPGQTHG
jgi:GNAT superfamily N-acetyltransferase